MKTLECSPVYLPFLCQKLGYVPTAYAQCIVCVEDGAPIAGVIYDCYNVRAVSAHIWREDGKVPLREWYAAIFDYPFNRLKVHKIGGQVSSANAKAAALDEHFGFVKEAVVTDYLADGDLYIYTMTKDQCHILTSPLWSKVVDKVARMQ